MSFIIQCPACPTQLSVEANMSGKQVRCPNCNTILDVGTLPPSPLSPVSAAKQSPQAGAARPQPNLLATKTAPGDGKKAPATQRDFKLDASDGPPRPRSSGGSGSRALYFLIALVVGLGGGAAAGFFGFRAYIKSDSNSSSNSTTAPKPPPDDLLFLPNNCQVVASVTVPKLLSSQAYKELAEKGAGLDSSEAEILRELTGAAPEDIERLTFGATQSPVEEWTLIVRSSKPVRVDELKAASGESDPKLRTVGTHTIYRTAFGGAFFVPDDAHGRPRFIGGGAWPRHRARRQGGSARRSEGRVPSTQQFVGSLGRHRHHGRPGRMGARHRLERQAAQGERSGRHRGIAGRQAARRPNRRPLQGQSRLRGRARPAQCHRGATAPTRDRDREIPDRRYAHRRQDLCPQHGTCEAVAGG